MLMAGGQTWQQYNQSGSFASFPQVISAVRTRSQYFPLFYLIDNAVIRLARSHSDLLLRLVNVLWLLLGLQGLLRFFRNYSESTRLFALAIFALNGYMLIACHADPRIPNVLGSADLVELPSVRSPSGRRDSRK